jgi:hypothetical protein
MLFSTAIMVVLVQGQKSVGFVKIPEEDILPAKSLRNITASDSGWVFGYDQVGYIKKMAVEDIPTITSFQKGVLLNRSALQGIWARESGYAVGYDGNGNLVKLPISAILDDDWRAFTNEEIGVGSGHVFTIKTGDFPQGVILNFIKVSIDNIPLASRSLNIVYGADSGYVIGFETRWAGNDLRKIPISVVPEVPMHQLSTVIAADSGYVMGLDSQGRLIRVSLSELEMGYASSLANRIIDADSGFVVCRVVA